MKTSEVHVAVAVIIDQAQHVLITRRHNHAHQGGLWEFPGGKIEAGESVEQALQREIGEEVGLRVNSSQPLITLRHDYGDKKVRLEVRSVTAFQGQAAGKEGQAWQWVPCSQLRQYEFPAANQAIIDAIQLPDHYLITPEPGHNPGDFLTQFDATLRHHPSIRLVQLRAKQLGDQEYRQLAEQVIARCHAKGINVMLNAEPSLVVDVGADGVHLTSQRLMALRSRPLPAQYWLAASCHNEVEICHAIKIGVNFVVLGPVLATNSHPGTPALGWSHFGHLVEVSSIPVYALGGMRAQQVNTAKAWGAQGIAAISGFWPSDGIL